MKLIRKLFSMEKESAVLKGFVILTALDNSFYLVQQYCISAVTGNIIDAACTSCRTQNGIKNGIVKHSDDLPRYFELLRQYEGFDLFEGNIDLTAITHTSDCNCSYI